MKLLNFSIDGVRLETAGQVFDLHNFFKLCGYTYNTRDRLFEISLKGDAFFDDTKAITDLKIIFRHVSCLRIYDRSFDEQNVCFEGMQYVSEMEWEPDLVTQNQAPTLSIGETTPAGSEREVAPIDWSTYMYIDFIWGVEILVAAETVEVSFIQSSSIS